MLGRLTMLLLTALLLAACGGDDGGSTGSETDPTPAAGEGGTPIAEPAGPDSSGAAPEEQAEGTLVVELRNVGSKGGAGLPRPVGITCTRSLPATCRETIECPVPEDGDPADQRVCAWLRRTGLELLLDEPPVDQVCTEVYGGPELATVVGTVDGQEVDATFSRQDGCAIARFDAIAPLWTGVVGSDGAVESGGAEPEPRIVDDPPEAFELESER